MGKGIALEFNKRFDMKNKLSTKFKSDNWSGKGYSLSEGKVFNLVTKEKYWNKPTYETLKQALCSMKEEMLFLKVWCKRLLCQK
jgi:hypothetical protein